MNRGRNGWRSADFIAEAEKFGARNYAPLEVVVARGYGCFVWDVEGKRYFDMLSAYSALNQGHCHPHIVAALREQAGVLTLTSRAFHNDKMGAFLERLCQLTGFGKALLMNSGAEAVESAIKLMRRWGYEKKGVRPGEARIVVAAGNFHGRTTTLVGLSDDPSSFAGYGPPTPGFVRVPYGDAAAVEAALGPDVVGVLLEPIQGEAGVIIPPDSYLPAVRKACDKAGALLCLDEVQTGFGRTGKLFAWEHTGTRPDILVMGKALSGGVYPISAIAADAAVMDVFTPGTHGSTYGGNPLAAAVGLAALDVIVDEQLAERSARLGAQALEFLRTSLRGARVAEVRGRGLMLAVQFTGPVAHEAVVALAKRGLLAKDTHATTVRLAPPLVISEQQLAEALEIASSVFAAV